MQNCADDFENGQADVDLEDEPLSAVVSCAETFVSAFVSCDERLLPDESAPVVPLLKPFRGAPSLTPKGRTTYAVDDPAVDTVEVRISPSCFPRHNPATLRFFSVYASQPEPSEDEQLGLERRIVAKAGDGLPVVRTERVVSHPVCVGCFKNSGMNVLKSKLAATTGWSLYWGARLKEEGFKSLVERQRVNHFPGTYLLGRKDNLAKQVRLRQQTFRKDFDFVPFTYTLPADMALLEADVRRGGSYIVKPPASACGKGIFLFRDTIPESLRTPARPESPVDQDNDDSLVVQRYISNPNLINGFKFDLRVYVVCTSWDPLRLYVFNDGLARFASEPYPTESEGDDLQNIFRHLTNYSINKKSDTFVKTNSAEEDGSGTKWTLHALRKLFEANGWSWSNTWDSVVDTIVKTFISCEEDVYRSIISSIKGRSSCFELYGFDIMLDDELKPILLEVNVMPSLACASALDKHVKGHLVADLLTMVGVPFVEGSDQKATNHALRSRKFDSNKMSPEFFSTHATEEDKAVLRISEEELRRCGGFTRVFPTPSSRKRYGKFFLTRRHYTEMLLLWEEMKGAADPSTRHGWAKWLADEGPFPTKEKEKRPVERRRASSRPARKPASRTLSSARLSNNVRQVTQKVQLPEKPLCQPIRVNTFSFIPVTHK